MQSFRFASPIHGLLQNYRQKPPFSPGPFFKLCPRPAPICLLVAVFGIFSPYFSSILGRFPLIFRGSSQVSSLFRRFSIVPPTFCPGPIFASVAPAPPNSKLGRARALDVRPSTQALVQHFDWNFPHFGARLSNRAVGAKMQICFTQGATGCCRTKCEAKCLPYPTARFYNVA